MHAHYMFHLLGLVIFFFLCTKFLTFLRTSYMNDPYNHKFVSKYLCNKISFFQILKERASRYMKKKIIILLYDCLLRGHSKMMSPKNQLFSKPLPPCHSLSLISQTPLSPLVTDQKQTSRKYFQLNHQYYYYYYYYQIRILQYRLSELVFLSKTDKCL